MESHETYLALFVVVVQLIDLGLDRFLAHFQAILQAHRATDVNAEDD